MMLQEGHKGSQTEEEINISLPQISGNKYQGHCGKQADLMFGKGVCAKYFGELLKHFSSWWKCGQGQLPTYGDAAYNCCLQVVCKYSHIVYFLSIKLFLLVLSKALVNLFPSCLWFDDGLLYFFYYTLNFAWVIFIRF